jgi:hypothetical protein
MPSNFSSLTVDWYDATDSYVTTSDITPDVKSIPLFTDTGTGEVNEARIVLRATDGEYIISGNEIDNWDRFRIRCTDLDGNSYDKYFEVVQRIPSISKSEGQLLTLNLLGIEYHTQHVHMSSPYWFEDAYTVVNDICNIYNRLKGAEQPWISNHDITHNGTIGNGAPFYTSNNYEYGIHEDKCYNRLIDVLEKLGASVSAGGALTFYELNFVSSGVNALDLNFRASGDNTPTETIQTDTTPNYVVGDSEGLMTNPTGSHVVAWGSNDHGSLPYEYTKYFSNVEAFLFRPEWTTGLVYAVDAIVKVTDTTTQIAKHYKANTAHTAGGTFAGDIANWDQIDMSDEFGDTTQYSPWTDGKARLWSNSGADPQRNTYLAGAWFDINTIIQDEKFFRTWVNVKATTDAELETFDGADGYSYEVGDINYFPNGFRVLVNSGAGTATGELAGFDNMVVEYRRTGPTQYEWKKLYSFDSDNDYSQIVVLHEGIIYQYLSTTPSWTAINTDAYGNDCIHPWSTAPVAQDGFDIIWSGTTGVPRADILDNTNFPDITKDGAAFATNGESAVEFKSTMTTIAKDALDAAGWTDGNDDYYMATVGCNFAFPYPVNRAGGISEGVGELYGGGGAVSWSTPTAYTRGDKVINGANWYICIEAHTSGTFATDLNTNHYWQLYYPEPSVLDAQNMRYARDGQIGWNADDSVLDLGQINALAFWTTFSLKDPSNVELNDKHRFRAWFADTKDNVVFQDFTIDHSQNWQDVVLPISGFRIYRGRKPFFGVLDALQAQVLPPKELEILNIFEWRNIKIGGIQYQSTYDEHGRYNPVGASVKEEGNSVSWATLTGATFTLAIDGFRFIKPLVAHSGEETTRNIEPDFIQRPNTTNFVQLTNDALSQLEVEKFKHVEWNIETAGNKVFNIPFGDSFLFIQDNVIDVDAGDQGANEDATTIQLVAKRIEYSITKVKTGKGGLRRKIKASKVFT